MTRRRLGCSLHSVQCHWQRLQLPAWQGGHAIKSGSWPHRSNCPTAEVDNTTGGSITDPANYTTVITPIPGGLTFVSVASGPSVSCGVSANFSAYCWGDGESGELGNGSRGSSSAPVPAMPARQFSAVCVGTGFVCGIDSATRGAFCWGANSRGQLGSGNPTNTSDSLEGVEVVGGLAFSPVVACGRDFACAITAANGTASNDTYCWCAEQSGLQCYAVAAPAIGCCGS